MAEHAGDTAGLPPRPREPLDSDCCGTGCTPCVLDIYEQEVALWEKECDRILHGAADAAPESDVMSPDRYGAFELVDIRKETDDALRVTFLIPDNRRLPAAVGQHLLLRCTEDGEHLTRQYTPVSDPAARGHFEFVIKLYADGAMSKHIRRWRLGDRAEWRGPFGDFIYAPNTYKRVVMLAAGTGVAPMIQVTRRILGDPADETRVHLVCAYGNYKDILCKKLIEEWRDYWNFTCSCYLSQESEAAITSTKKYGESVICGRLTEDLVEQIIGDPAGTRVLICGTKSFDKDMLNFLSRLDVEDKHIHKF